MDDFTIKLLSLQHVPVVGINNQWAHITRVSIMVGPYGPFTKDFAAGADSPEAVNAWKQTQAQNVRVIAGS